MAYGAFARPRRGDVEAPGDERRRRFERTGIAAAATCIFLLVVAMFVNAHNRSKTALAATETHSDVVLLACSGNRRRSRATLVDCDETRSNLFRAAQAHDRAVLLGSDAPSPSTLDALSELPEEWARSATRKPLCCSPLCSVYAVCCRTALVASFALSLHSCDQDLPTLPLYAIML